MKFFKFIFCLSMAGISLVSSSYLMAVTATSRTFFSMPSQFRSAMPVYVATYRNDLLNYSDRPQPSWWRGGAFEAVFYGSGLTNEGSAKLATYLLPPGCIGNCLRVYEAGVENPVGKNLDSSHFNVVTNNGNFASRIFIKPERTAIGIGFSLKKALTFDCDGLARWWLELMVPVEKVETTLNLAERIENNGGGPLLSSLGLDNSPHVGCMIAAFKQPNWKFGQINNNCRKKEVGVADVILKLGLNSVTLPAATLNSWIGAVIPAGTRIDRRVARELFPAVVGNNFHWGFAFGGSVAFKICEFDGWCVSYLFDSAGRYLFANKQVRSFDLIGKPWSRYQETYASPEQAATALVNNDQYSGTFGTNVFTRCVNVTPHFNADLNTAILIEKYGCSGNAWMLEAGYNVYTRQSEAINFDDCNVTNGIALKALQGKGDTSVARTIKYNFPECVSSFDNGYKQISICDVDLESAAHPAFLTFTIYGSFGYQGSPEWPYFISVGASYEAAVKAINTAIDRWTAWGKIGFAF